jgi:putative phage-type endonuclease
MTCETKEVDRSERKRKRSDDTSSDKCVRVEKIAYRYDRDFLYELSWDKILAFPYDKPIHPKVEECWERARTNPKQGSDAWMEQRKEAHVNASSVAGMLGTSKYKSPGKSFRIKTGIEDDKVFLPAVQWGHTFEAEAVQKYCDEEKQIVLPMCLFVHPEYSWIAGSIDGLTLDGRIVEVKCPYSRTINPDACPPPKTGYLEQMLLNMEIMNYFDVTDYVEYKPASIAEEHEISYIKKTIPRDAAWFAAAIPKLIAFHGEVLEYERTKILPEKYSKIIRRRARKAPSNKRILYV